LRICKVNGGIRGAPNGDPVELHARKEEAFLCWFLSRGIELLLEFNRPCYKAVHVDWMSTLRSASIWTPWRSLGCPGRLRRGGPGQGGNPAARSESRGRNRTPGNGVLGRVRHPETVRRVQVHLECVFVFVRSFVFSGCDVSNGVFGITGGGRYPGGDGPRGGPSWSSCGDGATTRPPF
jgi:hypothetical protein